MKITKYTDAHYMKVIKTKKSKPGWLWGVWEWEDIKYEKLNISPREDKTIKNTTIMAIEGICKHSWGGKPFEFTYDGSSYEKPVLLMTRDEGKTVVKPREYWIFKDVIYKVHNNENYDKKCTSLKILEFIDKEHKKLRKLKNKYGEQSSIDEKAKEEYVTDNAYIYILSNQSMPNLLKIGFTKRSVEERVDELNAATGVPVPFTIEAYFQSEYPETHEERIHNALHKYRIEYKEFFNIELDIALTVIEVALGRPPCYLNEK
jgi:hypothetical protein